MGIEECYKGLTSNDKYLFQKSCRYLLNHTFIVKDKDEENNKMYKFVKKHIKMISSYFNLMSYDVIINEDDRIIILRNMGDIQSDKIQFKKVDGIILLCLMKIYNERMSSFNLSTNNIIRIDELRNEIDVYKTKDPIKRAEMEDSLKMFKKYNLITINGKIGKDEDCNIVLYPSLNFVIEPTEIESFYKNGLERISDKEENE